MNAHGHGPSVSRRVLWVVVLLCLATAACHWSRKTGTVKGLVLIQGQNELLALVVLDDGKEVLAYPKIFFRTEGGGGWKLAQAGQRVEVEPMKDSKYWRIVRALDK